jgi:glycolate oxidase iron-sulfur subunit
MEKEKKVKIQNPNRITSNNLREEISEQLEGCIKCGMCKAICPVFKSTQEEALSPRGKSILLSAKVLDEIVFKCNLCKACEEKCPIKLKICDCIKKARQALSLKGKNIPQNSDMIENVRRTGNPFGEISPEGSKISGSDKLYCC